MATLGIYRLSRRLNQQLRQERAAAIFNILPKDVQSQIISRDGAPITDCITENNNDFERGLNRSVAFILTESTVSPRGEEISVMSFLDCDLGAIKKECGIAAGQCAAIQDTYCKDHYSKPEDIEKNYRDNRRFANSWASDYPNAAPLSRRQR
jgi:hypothetical protein